MKNKTKVISIVLFISALIMLISCQKQKAEWKGTIEEFNGVTIVKNPKEPLYGEEAFQLKEELTIGEREGREEYMFSRLSQLAINEQGDIFVLDIMEKHVKVFNRHGLYLKTFGRSGQGPGEISGLPWYFTLSKQNELILIDTSGVSFFSLDGKFLRKIPNKSFKSQIQLFDADTNSNSYIFQRSPLKQGYELNKYDSNLKLIKTIEFSPSQGVENIRKNGWNPFYPWLMYEITENGRIICARNDKYEIRVYDNDENKLLMRILKEYVPVRLTQKDIEEYLEGFSPQEIKSMNLPANLPPFNYFQSDEEERIFVETFERASESSNYYDVFDKEGKYLVKIPLPSYPFIKKNKVYFVLEDEDGYQYVKRYKVTWKY